MAGRLEPKAEFSSSMLGEGYSQKLGYDYDTNTYLSDVALSTSDKYSSFDNLAPKNIKIKQVPTINKDTDWEKSSSKDNEASMAITSVPGFDSSHLSSFAVSERSVEVFDANPSTFDGDNEVKDIKHNCCVVN